MADSLRQVHPPRSSDPKTTERYKRRRRSIGIAKDGKANEVRTQSRYSALWRARRWAVDQGVVRRGRKNLGWKRGLKRKKCAAFISSLGRSPGVCNAKPPVLKARFNPASRHGRKRVLSQRPRSDRCNPAAAG